MGVGRKLSSCESDIFDATGLADNITIRTAYMDGRAAAEIGKLKRRLSVTAISSADQVEEDVVLGDWKGLALAEEPAYWCEVETDQPDFAYVWFAHLCLL